MYKFKKVVPTQLKVNASYEGITIEEKVARITQNKEPITDGAPLNYTERKDGVKPEYDIRTDRFELGVEATDIITGSYIAKREERHSPKMEVVKGGKEGEGGAQSTDGTNTESK